MCTKFTCAIITLAKLLIGSDHCSFYGFTKIPGLHPVLNADVTATVESTADTAILKLKDDGAGQYLLKR